MKQNRRRFLLTGHIGSPHQRYEYQDIMDAMDEQPEIMYDGEILPNGTKFCEYIDKCNLACFQNTERYGNCRVRKFKDKWEKQ